ncbi:MAG: hypothetical protein ACPHF3_01670 [Pseudomonadales bacterium]
MKRLKLLTTLVSIVALGLAGCADSENAVSEVTPPPAPIQAEVRSEPIAYVEYLQCRFGENYSPESFAPYLAAWNAEIDGMTDRGLSAFGYLPNDWRSDAFDGVWVLRWNDKESRDAGWQEYAASGAAERLREEYPGLIECAPNDGLDLFAFNTYSQKSPTKTWTQQNPPYAATMQFCSMIDGKAPSVLRDHVTDEFLPYLKATDARIKDNTYWYQVAFMDEDTSTGDPSTATGEFDFVWMNFWETLDQQSEGSADWAEHGAAMQAKFDEIIQCGDEIPYRGHYFRTPANS